MRQPLLWILAGGIFLLAAAPSGVREASGARQLSNFKNIQVLADLTDREIQRTMQEWSGQLGVQCVGCHVQGDFASDAPERKRIARQMVGVVVALNETEFFRSSERSADCFLCHRGSLEVQSAP